MANIETLIDAVKVLVAQNPGDMNSLLAGE